MKASGERFSIELRAMPGWDQPAAKRLARFLKMAKRSYGMACTGCRESLCQNSDDPIGDEDIYTPDFVREIKPKAAQ